MWRALATRAELSLAFSLANGQSFGWRRAADGSYLGVIGRHVLALREHAGTVEWRALQASDASASSGAGTSSAVSATSTTPVADAATAELERSLRDYFQLDTDLSALYATWSSADARTATIARCLPGMRILRQDPVECLFSFICSSNNNIARITQMLDKLRARYGEPLLTVAGAVGPPAVAVAAATPSRGAADAVNDHDDDDDDDTESEDEDQFSMASPARAPSALAASSAAAASPATPRAATDKATSGSGSSSSSSSSSSTGTTTWYTFPSIEALAGAREADLRGLGLGYRARFVRDTAATLLARGGEEYLRALRTKDTAAVAAALQDFQGVGRKVADCVALFSLDQRGAIPVDTHVWAIACCYYDRSLTGAKSLTPAIYERVGALFRTQFGEYAGWAHSLLFAAELPAFRSLLPDAVRTEMQEFRATEKEAKAAKRVEAAARKAAKEAAAASSQSSSGGAASSSSTAAAVATAAAAETAETGDEEAAGQADEAQAPASPQPPQKRRKTKQSS